MMSIKTRVAEGGRVVIPAHYRRQMGIDVGDEVMLRLEGGELRITTLRQAVRRAQELVRRYVPEGHSLADELVEDRRREARDEP
ncbi:MAG: AbrB/MazE/SpoVT family DNA-binding domain-containing protein [Chloroflexota bacterium]|nr:AbrB/MazE/SpoVT family DNA-binding domain-containing protein [Chloroflexota bacterium]